MLVSWVGTVVCRDELLPTRAFAKRKRPHVVEILGTNSPEHDHAVATRVVACTGVRAHRWFWPWCNQQAPASRVQRERRSGSCRTELWSKDHHATPHRVIDARCVVHCGRWPADRRPSAITPQ